MEPLSARHLLQAWERGLGEGPVDRALTLWQAVCPETPRETLARLSVGCRDANLLGIREHTFGTRMISLVTCTQCHQGLELAFDVSDVRARPPTAPLLAPGAEAELAVEGYELRFRLPSSLDLTALLDQPEPADERRPLFERCVCSASKDGRPVEAHELPGSVVDAVAARMAEVDPQADIEIEAVCPSCGHAWKSALDIASYLWAEIDASARRLVQEVHRLASVYHWSESEILALSASRRQVYLELVGQ